MDEDILQSMLRWATDIYTWAIATEFQLDRTGLIEFLEQTVVGAKHPGYNWAIISNPFKQLQHL